MPRIFVVGVDEAGRGPLAGPLSLATVCIPTDVKLNLRGLKDSKKLSPNERESWFSKIKNWERDGRLFFSHVFISNKVIDRRGMSFALRTAVARALEKLPVKEKQVKVLLDGSLYAPSKFKQTTIIRGDELKYHIALASIVAKVRRDRYMVKLAKKEPLYMFEVHKGYGTLSHRKLIKKHGISDSHRLTFLRNLIDV